MRKRVSSDTFQEIIAGFVYLDKTYASNQNLVVGLEYTVKEFNFNEWKYTGKIAKLRVSKILSPVISGGFDVQRINQKYKFFSFEVMEVNQ